MPYSALVRSTGEPATFTCLAAARHRVLADASDGVTIAFTHCPFRELAEANPDLVCGLHRGMVEGFVDGLGTGQMGAFRTLVDRVPCQTDVVELRVR